jgi:large subunit ribosomal protein L22
MANVTIKTGARFVRTAPDKIRNLAGLVRGKNLDYALQQLEFAGKFAAKPLGLVLKQAKAQIKDQNLVENDFTIKEVRVDEGPKLKRRRICHQGRSTAILKRMSHITITLTNDGNSKFENRKSKIELKKPKQEENKKEDFEIRNSDLDINATEGSV